MANPPSLEESDKPDGTVRNGVPMENLVLKVTTVCGGIAGLVFLVAWLVNLRADVNIMRSDIIQIKQSVQSLNRVSELESKISEIRQYGSDTARKCEKDVAELRRDFEMHKATTSALGNGNGKAPP